jgi:hypothetical protein
MRKTTGTPNVCETTLSSSVSDTRFFPQPAKALLQLKAIGFALRAIFSDATFSLALPAQSTADISRALFPTPYFSWAAITCTPALRSLP